MKANNGWIHQLSFCYYACQRNATGKQNWFVALQLGNLAYSRFQGVGCLLINVLFNTVLLFN